MSKKGISKEFKIGIVLIVSIALLIWGLSYLKGVDLFDTQREYYSRYDQIDGLAVGNPVILNGYQIGQVRKIDFEPKGDDNLVVTYSVNVADVQIPADTEAKIYSSDLLGSKAIEIVRGDSSVMAEPGQELAGIRQVEFTQALRKELEPLKKSTEQLIKSVEEVVTNFKVVFESEATQGLPKAFESLESTLANLESTSARLDNMVAENSATVERIFGNVESITNNLNENEEKLNNIFTNFETVSDSLSKVNFSQTIRKADRAMANFEQIMQKVNEGDGSLGKLVNNDTLHNQLVEAANELELLIDDINANPKKYLHFSVFGKNGTKELSEKEMNEIREEAKEAAREEVNKEKN